MSSKEKFKSNLELTDSEFAELEKEFGELIEAEVRKDGEVVGAIAFHQPTEFVMKKANQVLISDKDVDKRNQIIIRNCAVNGLEFIEKNPGVERSLYILVDKIVTPYETSLKKRRKT